MALLSTPWPLFNRPSIQLGALKAYVEQELPHVTVDTHHVYLTVAAALGYDLYGPISERTWLSESCYAGLLYPEQQDAIARFWRRRSPGVVKKPFEQICQTLEKVSHQILGEIPWNSYVLLGLSVSLNQLTSALYFIHQVKRRTSDLKVVVGGSACSGDMGQSLLRVFPDIDFVISGEGEKPLLHLLKFLMEPRGSGSLQPMAGLFSRDAESTWETEPFSQEPDLDRLPAPDYREYFDRLNALSPPKRFFPKLPVETSRGCWWRKPSPQGEPAGCAFCNLNIQWNGYRAKSHDNIIAQIRALSEGHQILSLSFMDNLLPAKEMDKLFRRIAEGNRNYRLFAEIRATTRKEALAAMGAAGMAEVQVGVEALSTGLLKKMNKGTTAIQNLEIMKNCEIPGLPRLTGNVILNFPGSDQKDVEETLKNLSFALPFQPLKGTPFWLGYGSPVWQNPKAFGIKRVHNHPFYARLFPPEVFKDLVLMIQGYHGGMRYQERLWRPVKQALEDWKTAYLSLHQNPKRGPILSYQDGGDFMIIRQRRHRAQDMTHRLRGTSRKIYLFCQENRPLSQIVGKFPDFGEEAILPFLNMMVDKKLMFTEGARYLSLAVPLRLS
jgi:ribosomal peptide maturation radical SAM protein 1